MITNDPFSIDIALHHPTFTTERISNALSITSRWSADARHNIKVTPKGGTHFYATLQEGNSPEDYENALGKAVLFLEKNAAF